MQNLNELRQLIMESDDVYTYLLQYFIEDITTSEFSEYMKQAVENGMSEREVLSVYFASWILWEEQSEKLIEKLLSLR